VTVPTVDIERYNEWAGPYGLTLVPRPGALRQADQVLWHRVLAQRTLYVSYDSVQPLDQPELDEVSRLARSRTIDRVVVDIRQNLGGEVGEDAPLLKVLSDPRVARPGRLFLLTGRNTFSAAVLFAAALQQRTPVTVVGEAPGGGPAAYGNSEPVRMEHTGLVLSVATTRETATPRERRHVLVPDVAVPLSSVDYFAGRDPVLEAALHR
jgi:C-terminal processing protease CtpA/Prc